MGFGRHNGTGCQEPPGANVAPFPLFWSEDELTQVEAHSHRQARLDADPLTAPPDVGSSPELNGRERPAAASASDPDASRRELYVREIIRFTRERKDRDTWVTREQLGKAEDRPFLISRSIIDNVAEYYRQHPQADRGVGVLVLDSLYADNKAGCSTVSAVRMGKLLSCDERTVRRCREQLYEDALVNREKKPGFGDQYWPAINKFLLSASVNPTYWLDATSAPPARRGRKPRTGDAGDIHENPGQVRPGYSANNPGQVTPGSSGNSEIPRTGDANTPDTAMSDDLTSDLTRKREGGTDAPPTLHPKVHGQQKRTPAEGLNVDAALDAYNEMAIKHDFLPCIALTSGRRTRLGKRLRDIGGLAEFKRALSAIQRDDYLAGRKRPKEGKPFKLDLDYLLRADDSVGDVLAKLLDLAGEAVASKPGVPPGGSAADRNMGRFGWENYQRSLKTKEGKDDA
jgi:hypothetical protein